MDLFQSSFLNKMNDDKVVINSEVQMMESQLDDNQEFNGESYFFNFISPTEITKV